MGAWGENFFVVKIWADSRIVRRNLCRGFYHFLCENFITQNQEFFPKASCYFSDFFYENRFEIEFFIEDLLLEKLKAFFREQKKLLKLFIVVSYFLIFLSPAL